jgi:tetratricopeptide (TPR) repeat protein
LDFCRQLRSFAKYRHVPIILMTTESYRHDVAIASEVGIDRYLLKPFSLDTLSDQIFKVLKSQCFPTPYDLALQDAARAFYGGHLAVAEESYLKAREMNPNGGRPGVGLARIANARADPKKAIQYLRQTIESNPDYIEAHRLLMDIFLEIGAQDRYYRQAAILNELSPDNPIYLVALAEKALDLGDFAAAEAHYRRSVLLSPAMGAAHRGLGDIAFSREEYERAEKHYKKALDLEPRNISCLNSLGLTFVKIGRFKEGMSKYMTALSISPENPKVLFNLGHAWEKQENYGKAQVYYQHALKADAENSKAQKGLERLRKWIKKSA